MHILRSESEYIIKINFDRKNFNVSLIRIINYRLTSRRLRIINHTFQKCVGYIQPTHKGRKVHKMNTRIIIEKNDGRLEMSDI